VRRQTRTVRESASQARQAFVKVFSGETVKQTLVYYAEGVKQNRVFIGLSSEQFPDHPLEQNVVTLQPVGDENLFVAARRNQFPGQELSNPHPLATKFLEQQFDNRAQSLLRWFFQRWAMNLVVLVEKLSAGFQDYRPVESLFASEVVTDAGNIGPRAFADFTKVRSVESRFRKQNTGSVEDAFASR
jgi:hypothetical protein